MIDMKSWGKVFTLISMSLGEIWGLTKAESWFQSGYIAIGKIVKTIIGETWISCVGSWNLLGV